MVKLTKQNVNGTDYSMVGCALTGVCPTSAAEYVKVVTLSDGDELSDGMTVVITFANGNTAGNAPASQTIYSSDQVNYYSDSGLTVPFTLAPSGCYTTEYTGEGNAYTYQSFPVLQIGTITAPVCNARGYKAAEEVWEAGDKVTVQYVEGLFCVLAAGNKQKQADWTQSNSDAVDFIKHKPSIPTKTSDLQNDSGFITSASLPIAVSHQFNLGTMDATTKIKIDINSTKQWMLCFTVTLYQAYRAVKVMISGYNYIGGNSYWYSPKAVLLGDTDLLPVKVYFGYNSLGHLWVGFDGGSFTGISITDVTNGYEQVDNPETLFTITDVASLATEQESVFATSHADAANTASYASRAGDADTAHNATNATHAGSADSATNAGNADTVDGYHASENPYGSTVGARTINGYFNAAIFHDDWTEENINSYSAPKLMFKGNGDGYLRNTDPSLVRVGSAGIITTFHLDYLATRRIDFPAGARIIEIAIKMVPDDTSIFKIVTTYGVYGRYRYETQVMNLVESRNDGDLGSVDMVVDSTTLDAHLVVYNNALSGTYTVSYRVII